MTGVMKTWLQEKVFFFAVGELQTGIFSTPKDPKITSSDQKKVWQSF